jgi:hypothetical protein
MNNASRSPAAGTKTSATAAVAATGSEILAGVRAPSFTRSSSKL